MIDSPYDQNNVFARILRSEIPCALRFENEHALAFDDIAPKAAVHVVVIPKGPYRTMDELASRGGDAELAAFTRALGKVVSLTGLDKTGYRLISNNGADAGQEVPHLHVHVVGGKPLGRMLE